MPKPLRRITSYALVQHPGVGHRVYYTLDCGHTASVQRKEFMKQGKPQKRARCLQCCDEGDPRAHIRHVPSPAT